MATLAITVTREIVSFVYRNISGVRNSVKQQVKTVMHVKSWIILEEAQFVKGR